MIQHVLGDATRPYGAGPRVIVHLCDDSGAWGGGFARALSGCWAQPEARYDAWWRGDDTTPFKLGRVQFVAVEPGLWVANLLGQRGTRHVGGAPPIRYPAVRAGLRRVAAFAREQGATLHMPRLGAGPARGDWATIAGIIVVELGNHGIAVTVYDLR
jgi:O-acetyl-ADP-ribose deacetylase (regulator of RNase III)